MGALGRVAAAVGLLGSLLAVIMSGASALPALPRLEQLLEAACDSADLNLSWKMASRLAAGLSQLSSSDAAGALHAQSALAMILQGDADMAVSLHLQAKRTNGTVIPPLAQLHLSGRQCGGLGDLFYVTAVLIKQRVDARNASQPAAAESYSKLLHEGHTTLLTLAADSGLHAAAETHLARALALTPDDASLHFRAALLTPGVFESDKHLAATRQLLHTRVDALLARTKGEVQGQPVLALPKINEFVLSPTFYLVYQGGDDRPFLEKLHASYALAHPPLAAQLAAHPSSAAAARARTASGAAGGNKIHVGFVSAHFRRHSICKLFCGLATRLDKAVFRTYLFSALQENFEDSTTAALAAHGGIAEFVRIGKTMAYNRQEVTSRAIDVLVYLDVGMDPATVVWAGECLCFLHCQRCTVLC